MPSAITCPKCGAGIVIPPTSSGTFPCPGCGLTIHAAPGAGAPRKSLLEVMSEVGFVWFFALGIAAITAFALWYQTMREADQPTPTENDVAAFEDPVDRMEIYQPENSPREDGLPDNPPAREVAPSPAEDVPRVQVLAALLAAKSEQDLSERELVALIEPSVVTVVVPGKGSGSGFAVGDGRTVITNLHVVGGANAARVKLAGGALIDVEGFLSFSTVADLAVLTLTSEGKLPPLALAGESPEKGDRLLAFGAPFGLSGSVSDGIVSAVRNTENQQTWIQTTVPISKGNSGGPLVNMQGQVVGVNTFMLSPAQGAQNLNFAIAARHVEELLSSAQQNSVQPLRQLPTIRRVGLHRGGSSEHDPAGAVIAQRTLAYWEAFLEANAQGDFSKGGQSPQSLQHDAAVCQSRAEAIRGLEKADVDPTLIKFSTETAVAYEVHGSSKGAMAKIFAPAKSGNAKAAKAYNQLAARANASGQALAKSGELLSPLRSWLSNKYGRHFSGQGGLQ